jgi:hypothetical protein
LISAVPLIDGVVLAPDGDAGVVLVITGAAGADESST